MNEKNEITETTEAYKEYMVMADNLFTHLRNGTVETFEEAAKITKRQDELWEQMTDEERHNADATILRTVISIKAGQRHE